MARYIAFDVETPNRLNHRMSAIGITAVEDGAIREEFYSLVDPETDFPGALAADQAAAGQRDPGGPQRGL